MFKKFIKYQSLGNDFIIFDLLNFSENIIDQEILRPDFKNFIINICNRNFGVGADGVLILKNNQELNIPESYIFNSDGSRAQVCFNGLRCISDYLYNNHKFPENFKIKMGPKVLETFIQDKLVINKIEGAKYLENKTIKVLDQEFNGHIVNVGNPHFIILDKIDLSFLKKYGPLIESHEYFPEKTNVEFLNQEDKNVYNLLIYERGAGITLACSSGVTASLWALFKLNKIKHDQEVIIKMLGGQVSGFIDSNNKIVLKAQAIKVFDGILERQP